MEIDIRPLFGVDVLVIQENPDIALWMDYWDKMVNHYVDCMARGIGVCTPSRKCNLTAKGKDDGQRIQGV